MSDTLAEAVAPVASNSDHQSEAGSSNGSHGGTDTQAALETGENGNSAISKGSSSSEGLSSSDRMWELEDGHFKQWGSCARHRR